MKIKTRVMLIVLLPVTLGLVLGVVQFWFANEREKLETLGTEIEQISTGVFELTLLAHEFSLHPSLQRIRVQWSRKYAAVGAMLDQTHFQSITTRNINQELHSPYAALSRLFEQLISIADSMSDNSGDTQQVLAQQSLLTGQLIARAQALVSVIKWLEQRIADKLNNAARQRDRLILAMILAMVGVIAFIGTLLGKTILTRLAKLRQGIATIGSGDLRYRLELPGEDELAALGQTFNDMTDNLQRITASRDDLNHEVAERERAEAELQRLNTALEQRVEERTAALRESETRFRLALDNASIGTALVAPDGRWLYVNDALCQLVGYSREELLAIDFQTITHPDDLDTDLAYVQQVLHGEIPTYQMEKRYFHKDGHIVWILLGVSLVRSATGEPRYFISQIQDITQRKQAQQKLTELNIDLENQVQQRTAELTTANQELEAFAYSVSHDLRAPLRHIQGYAQLLTEAIKDQLSEEPLHYLQVIEETSTEMGTLIDDLLAFSRVGRADMQDADVPLDKVLHSTLNSLEMAIQARNIDWRLAPLPTVKGDPALLKHVFTNLLGNAIKYTAPRDPAQIEVGCSEPVDGWLTLFVRDNGVGFDMQYAHKLFGVFQRLHRADEFEGTGIGLAIVQRIIARHGGRIWAEAAPGQGATFYFTLPATA